MVTLLDVVRDIGVRTTLEDGNLLTITGGNTCTAQVACSPVCLARPYVEYLSPLQHR